jgi:hypothetical protein
MSSADDTWRIWLSDVENFALHGFGPNTRLAIDSNRENIAIQIGSAISFTHTLDSDPDNLFVDIKIPTDWDVNTETIFQCTWNLGTIIIEKLPLLPEVGFRIQEFGRLLQFVDFGKSSNSKFKDVHGDEFWSPLSYMSALFEVNQEKVYITATGSKITNLRKQLLQSTQYNFSVGIAIYRGHDWTKGLIERYINDDSLLDAYKDGFILIVQDPDDPSAIFIEGIAYNYGKRPVFRKIRQESYELERERDSTGEETGKVIVWDIELLAASNLLPNIHDIQGMAIDDVSNLLIELSNEIRIKRNG